MSRPRSSSRGSGANPSGRGGSARPAGRTVAYGVAPKSDVYVAMLGVSLGALIIAVLMLALRFNDYGFTIKP